MEKTIEVRLTSLARQILEQYQSQLESEYACQLDEAIGVCEKYQQGVGHMGIQRRRRRFFRGTGNDVGHGNQHFDMQLLAGMSERAG